MPAVKSRYLRSTSPIFHPLLHLGLLVGLSSAPPLMATSWAQETTQRSYEIPAGSLSAALTRFAGLAGVSLSIDPILLNGRSTPGLSGAFTVEEGFARLLQGSGLQLQSVGDRSYILQPIPDQSSEIFEISEIAITSNGGGVSGETYAGGQVKREGSQGMLGARDFMETPFNLTTYTQEAAKNQQARTLGDMVANDPSVRTTNPAGGRFEQFSIRGLSLFNSDVSYSGLYGIVPTYSIDMEMVDRVDILKGPSALLNGIAPRGSVGGGINIEPKRAGDEPLTEFTGSYASEGQFGGAVDIGRRFGEDKLFGIRFNGVRQSGDTTWDDQRVEREASVVGLDFRDERVRLSLDLGHTQRETDAPQERVEVTKGVKMPDADDIDDNFAPSWTYTHTKDTFGALRGEFDLSDSLMVYAAVGARDGEYRFLRSMTRLTNDAGDFLVTPRYFTRDEEVRTATVGLRMWFESGPVGHEVNLSLNHFYMEFDNAGVRYPTMPSNLYDPIDVARPTRPNRTDSSTHTEDRFSSVALADTLSLFDRRVLLTFGARLQRVRVDTWTNGEKDDVAFDDQKLSPAMGLVLKVTDRLSLYANYIEGLTQGDTAPSTANNANEVFAPYVSRQMEAGAKYDHGRFALTASVFRIKQPSYQYDAQRNYRPNGELRNRGVELNVFGEPFEGVRLLGGMMLLDSEQLKTGQGLNDGNRGTGSPEVNANLGAEWDIKSIPGLTLTGRVIYTSSQYLDPENEQKISSWERYDVGGRYAFNVSDKPVTVRASVENVLNETYWSSAATSADSAAGLTLSTPRTLLMSATVNF